jgi:short-subunit dehydrogenase
MECQDKVVLITGASAGIGRALAGLLAGEGARLALNARSAGRLEQVARELPGAAVFPADMSDEDAVRRMIDAVLARFGRLDVLVNNAGRGMHGPLASLDLAELRRLLELNVLGPLVAMQAAVPVMREQGGGAIVNVSSGTALMYAPGLAGYSATKRALGGLSLTARAELAGDGVVVSVVYPYVTRSDFYRAWVSSEHATGSADEYLAPGRPPADDCEYAARLILRAIRTGEAEVFAHDWMKESMR